MAQSNKGVPHRNGTAVYPYNRPLRQNNLSATPNAAKMMYPLEERTTRMSGQQRVSQTQVVANPNEIINNRRDMPYQRFIDPPGRPLYPYYRYRYPRFRHRYPRYRFMYPRDRHMYPDDRRMYPDDRYMYPNDRYMYPLDRSITPGTINYGKSPDAVGNSASKLPSSPLTTAPSPTLPNNMPRNNMSPQNIQKPISNPGGQMPLRVPSPVAMPMTTKNVPRPH